jgi:hypothetical protein
MATKTIGGLTTGLADDLDDTALVPIRNNDSVDRKYTVAQLRTQTNKNSSPTAGIGYTAGAGGAQTQATDKATTVVSNTITTAITMNAATLNAATIVSFTFTNSNIAATDQVVVTHQSAGTSGAYTFNAFPGAGSAVISVRNNTAGNLGEAIVLRVSVYKAVSA